MTNGQSKYVVTELVSEDGLLFIGLPSKFVPPGDKGYVEHWTGDCASVEDVNGAVAGVVQLAKGKYSVSAIIDKEGVILEVAIVWIGNLPDDRFEEVEYLGL